MLEKEERAGAGTDLTSSAPTKTWWQKHFTAKRMALMAVFVALAYTVSFLEVPLFPAAPFLKLDFGNVFIMLISFLLGPVEGTLVCLLKEVLRLLGSSSGGVGEIANFMMTTSYLLLPAIVYRYHKGLKVVIFSLCGGCALATGMALLCNRYINFPLYMGAGAKEAFAKFFWYVLGFNLIKTAAISIITVLLYKRLSNFLKKMKI